MRHPSCFSCFLFKDLYWWTRLHFRFWPNLAIFSWHASMTALSPAFSLENWSWYRHSWFHKAFREFLYLMRIFFVVQYFGRSVSMSRNMTKPAKWHVHPAKTQISLGIRPVWSESLLSAWRKLGFLATH